MNPEPLRVSAINSHIHGSALLDDIFPHTRKKDIAWFTTAAFWSGILPDLDMRYVGLLQVAISIAPGED